MGENSGDTESTRSVAASSARRQRPTHHRSRWERSFRQVLLLVGRLSSDKWEGRRTLGAHLILMLPALWLFVPAFDGGQVLAFRDGAHYYYPLWHWMDAEWKAGRPPLWNPQENNGVSLAADPTAGLWYPGIP